MRRKLLLSLLVLLTIVMVVIPNVLRRCSRPSESSKLMQESFRMHQIGNLLNAYAEKEGGFPENLHELRPFFSGTDEQFHLLVDDGVKLAYAASSGKTFPRLISEAFTTGANTWRIELREPATVVARNQRTNEIRLWFESADAGDPR